MAAGAGELPEAGLALFVHVYEIHRVVQRAGGEIFSVKDDLGDDTVGVNLHVHGQFGGFALMLVDQGIGNMLHNRVGRHFVVDIQVFRHENDLHQAGLGNHIFVAVGDGDVVGRGALDISNGGRGVLRRSGLVLFGLCVGGQLRLGGRGLLVACLRVGLLVGLRVAFRLADLGGGVHDLRGSAHFRHGDGGVGGQAVVLHGCDGDVLALGDVRAALIVAQFDVHLVGGGDGLIFLGGVGGDLQAHHAALQRVGGQHQPVAVHLHALGRADLGLPQRLRVDAQLALHLDGALVGARQQVGDGQGHGVGHLGGGHQVHAAQVHGDAHRGLLGLGGGHVHDHAVDREALGLKGNGVAVGGGLHHRGLGAHVLHVDGVHVGVVVGGLGLVHLHGDGDGGLRLDRILAIVQRDVKEAHHLGGGLGVLLLGQRGHGVVIEDVVVRRAALDLDDLHAHVPGDLGLGAPGQGHAAVLDLDHALARGELGGFAGFLIGGFAVGGLVRFFVRRLAVGGFHIGRFAIGSLAGFFVGGLVGFLVGGFAVGGLVGFLVSGLVGFLVSGLVGFLVGGFARLLVRGLARFFVGGLTLGGFVGFLVGGLAIGGLVGFLVGGLAGFLVGGLAGFLVGGLAVGGLVGFLVGGFAGFSVSGFAVRGFYIGRFAVGSPVGKLALGGVSVRRFVRVRGLYIGRFAVRRLVDERAFGRGVGIDDVAVFSIGKPALSGTVRERVEVGGILVSDFGLFLIFRLIFVIVNLGRVFDLVQIAVRVGFHARVVRLAVRLIFAVF